MALVYPNATLEPGKRELMNAWLPSRSWADPQPRKEQGSFRFDDPAGEVGLEGFLMGADDVPTVFVALSYRAEPIPGAEEHLVGTTEHSELGTRWVYDGAADPVFVRALLQAVLTGATGVDQEYDLGNGPESRATNAQVRGTGSSTEPTPEVTTVSAYDEGPVTIVDADGLQLVLARVVGTDLEAAQTLLCSWKEQVDVPIAGVR